MCTATAKMRRRGGRERNLECICQRGAVVFGQIKHSGQSVVKTTVMQQWNLSHLLQFIKNHERNEETPFEPDKKKLRALNRRKRALKWKRPNEPEIHEWPTLRSFVRTLLLFTGWWCYDHKTVDDDDNNFRLFRSVEREREKKPFDFFCLVWKMLLSS